MRSRALLAALLARVARGDWVAQYYYNLTDVTCSGVPITGQVDGSGDGGCFGNGGGSAEWRCNANKTATKLSYEQPNCEGAATEGAPVNTTVCESDDALGTTTTVCAHPNTTWLPPQAFVTATMDSTACPVPPGTLVVYTTFLTVPVPCMNILDGAWSRFGFDDVAAEGANGAGTRMPIPMSTSVSGCNKDGSVTFNLYTTPDCQSGNFPDSIYPSGNTSCIVGGGNTQLVLPCVGASADASERGGRPIDWLSPAGRVAAAWMRGELTRAGA